MWRYRELLGTIEPSAICSMGEGDTPLVPSNAIARRLGLERLYFKLENLNPTGSYKDRFASAAVTLMRMHGQRRCLGTSSGNAGCAVAAYCARAGFESEMAVIPDSPAGKLTQMRAYGCRIIRVKDFGADPVVNERVIDRLNQRCRDGSSLLQISAYRFCPEAMEGVKTISHEIVDADLDRPVDHVFTPAGGGGLTLAVCRGFQDMIRLGRLKKMPRVHCVQQEGNDTMAGPIREGLDRARPVRCTTRITGLQVGSINDGHQVVPAVRACGGSGQLVSDEHTWRCQRALIQQEGIFAEPAGATALAGLESALSEGLVRPHETVVCLVTGAGFKDPAALAALAGRSDIPTMDIDDYIEYQ